MTTLWFAFCRRKVEPLHLNLKSKKMQTSRNIATMVGGLFLTAAIASIAGMLLYSPILNDLGYIVSSSNHLRISLGAVLEITNAFAIIGTSLMLYPVLKEYDERMALGAVCLRVAEAIVIIVGILCLLTIVTLNVQSGKELNPDSSAYINIGKMLVAFHNWTFLYGPNVLLGPSTLMTAYVLYKANLVPRFVSILGLIGGPMIFSCGVLVTLGLFDQISVWGILLAIPVFVYEMSLALWLVWKGFNQETIPSAPMQNLYRLAGGITTDNNAL
jgi:hypothetical protein